MDQETAFEFSVHEPDPAAILENQPDAESPSGSQRFYNNGMREDASHLHPEATCAFACLDNPADKEETTPLRCVRKTNYNSP